MKKVLIGLLALVSVSAFAEEMTNGRSMVTLSGYESARSSSLDRSLDIYHSNGGASHSTTNSIALNYAYAFTDYMQLGASYRNWNNEGQLKAKNRAMTYGIFGIWNFAGRLSNTNYLAVKLNMGSAMTKDTAGTTTTDNKTQTVGFEFGHRFGIGSLWGMNYNWSPSLELSFAKLDPKHGTNSSVTDFRLNILKVDVLF
jgi:hypothetical protein